MEFIAGLETAGNEGFFEEDLLAEVGEGDGDVRVGAAEGGDEVAVDAEEGEEGDRKGNEAYGVACYDEAFSYHVEVWCRVLCDRSGTGESQ